MAKVIDLYEDKYGLTVKVLLRVLGGDPDAILSDMQDKIDHPSDVDSALFSMLNLAPLTAAQAADEANNLMLREIERLYFASIGRASAVAVCNALYKAGNFGSISIQPSITSLTYSAFAFMSAWNDNHPDEDTIIAPSPLEI